MSVSTTVKKYGIEQAFKFMYKDPETNLPKLMDWADTFCKGRFPAQRAAIRRAIEDPTYPYYDFVRHMMNEVDHDVLTTIVVNFFINANMVGCEKQEKLRKEHNCNIPWAILLDPTSACNLHCTGCWAAEYGNKLNLSFDEIDDIIRQGKDMGVYMYIYTGGEPLVRKADLIKLCEKHDDCIFLAFTNGTLIDEKFADNMLRVKNFVPAISLEGFEEATGSRRGEGVYGKATHAMPTIAVTIAAAAAGHVYTDLSPASLWVAHKLDNVVHNTSVNEVGVLRCGCGLEYLSLVEQLDLYFPCPNVVLHVVCSNKLVYV